MWLGVILVSGAGGVAATDLPSVRAVERSGPAPLWAGSGDEGLGAPHPPLEQIPAMPIPAPATARAEPSSRGLLAYDATTATVVELGELPLSGLEGGRVPGRGHAARDDDGPGLTGFADMSLVTDTAAFPWRMNAKLVMRFVTSGGGDAWYVCSGSMVDAETVLTAAHCVYNRDSAINGWAAEIFVYPGWTGQGSSSNRPVEPYGYGRGTYYIAGSGYVNDGDYDRDVAAVRITRAAGMLTGWFGTAWGYSCVTILGRTYHNASFPAESCGQPGLHNGRDMYYWYGSMNFCYANQIQLWTDGGCFNAGWGGMSGSGFYYIDGSSRYAHAVASTSDRSSFFQACKIWEQFFDDLHGSFIPGSRGSTFDLQALDVTSATVEVAAGGSVPGVSFLSTNPTNGAGGSGQWGLDVYLSTNDNLSTADRLLSSQGYTWDYPAMSSVRVNLAAPIIPIDTATGDYWLGVVLDSTSDGDPGNNDSDGWDAHPIRVTAVTDLVADSVTAPSGSFLSGREIQVAYQVSNRGADPSLAVTVEIRASVNTYISTADPLVATFAHPAIAGGEALSTSQLVTLPEELAFGAYHLGIIVSSADDLEAGNNWLAASGTVTVDFGDDFESADLSGWSSVVP